ncbi:prepilin-type N-terminal cleavage/methylation domain-containing protein [Sutterella sp.]|uniref:prepilin-type N-terminal cleavage/methylation domain-containing protein n=1 Tax=Sutterella sp. TaxID=1981025 RepID=UPI003FD70A8D
MRRNAGFTLLELVLVLVLLGALSAIFAAHFPKLNFTFESEFMESESRLREAVVYARNQQLLYQDGETTLTIDTNSATCWHGSTTRTFTWSDADVMSLEPPGEVHFADFGRRCSGSECGRVKIDLASKDRSKTLSLTIYESGYIGRTRPEEEGHEN